eukprot:7975265-Alexandrium_andersonii.AAC.1
MRAPARRAARACPARAPTRARTRRHHPRPCAPTRNPAKGNSRARADIVSQAGGRTTLVAP